MPPEPLGTLDPPAGLAPGVAAAIESIAAASGAWCPSLSPDGTRVAYVCDRSGLPRLEVASVQADDPVTVSGSDQEVISVAWAPTEQRLVYLVSPAGSIRAELHTVLADGSGRALLAGAGESETVFAGSWTADGRYACSIADGIGPGTRVVVVDPTTGVLQPVPAADPLGFSVVTAVSPDVTELIVRSGPRNRRRLFLVPLDPSGRAVPVMQVLDQASTGATDPVVATGEDGRFAADDEIYLRSYLGGNSLTLVRVGRLGPDSFGSPEPLAATGADVDAFALRAESRSALLVWNVEGRHRVELRHVGEPVVATPPTTVPLPLPVMAGWGLSRDGRELIGELTGPAAPRALYSVALPPDNVVERGEDWAGAMPARRLPAMPAVDLPQLVEPELLHYRSADGTVLSGWLYRAPGRATPGPTVVSFHGGPESQERPSFAQISQSLAVAGMSVFAPNVRGSSGYGLAFMSADDGAARATSFQDIPATVDHLVRQGIADPDAVGAYGWSYGGYLVMVALTRWPELFRAGAAHAGMADLPAFFAETEPWMAAASVTEYGDPVADAALLAGLSPLAEFDRLTAPLLLVHGEKDTNVPLSQSQRARARLRELNRTVEFVLLPGEGHAIVGTPNRVTAALAIARWFSRWLRREAKA